MVREQVVREPGEALLAVQIEGEVVPLRIDPEDDARSELCEEFFQSGKHQKRSVPHHPQVEGRGVLAAQQLHEILFRRNAGSLGEGVTQHGQVEPGGRPDPLRIVEPVLVASVDDVLPHLVAEHGRHVRDPAQRQQGRIRGRQSLPGGKGDRIDVGSLFSEVTDHLELVASVEGNSEPPGGQPQPQERQLPKVGLRDVGRRDERKKRHGQRHPTEEGQPKTGQKHGAQAERPSHQQRLPGDPGMETTGGREGQQPRPRARHRGGEKDQVREPALLVQGFSLLGPRTGAQRRPRGARQSIPPCFMRAAPARD